MINLDNLNFVNWDYPAIYEGVMSPENNFIMIIQNFWMTVTSSIGYIFLIPFFKVNLRKSGYRSPVVFTEHIICL